MAGNRQQSRFIALVSNAAELGRAMDVANGAAGASAQQVLKTMDSLETKVTKLKTAFQQLYLDLGIERLLGGLTEFATRVTQTISKLGIFKGLIPSILTIVNAFKGVSDVVGYAKMGVAKLEAVLQLRKENAEQQIEDLKGKMQKELEEEVKIAIDTSEASEKLDELIEKKHELATPIGGEAVGGGTPTTEPPREDGELFKSEEDFERVLGDDILKPGDESKVEEAVKAGVEEAEIKIDRDAMTDTLTRAFSELRVADGLSGGVFFEPGSASVQLAQESANYIASKRDEKEAVEAAADSVDFLNGILKTYFGTEQDVKNSQAYRGIKKYASEQYDAFRNGGQISPYSGLTPRDTSEGINMMLDSFSAARDMAALVEQTKTQFLDSLKGVNADELFSSLEGKKGALEQSVAALEGTKDRTPEQQEQLEAEKLIIEQINEILNVGKENLQTFINSLSDATDATDKETAAKEENTSATSTEANAAETSATAKEEEKTATEVATEEVKKTGEAAAKTATDVAGLGEASNDASRKINQGNNGDNTPSDKRKTSEEGKGARVANGIVNALSTVARLAGAAILAKGAQMQDSSSSDIEKSKILTGIGNGLSGAAMGQSIGGGLGSAIGTLFGPAGTVVGGAIGKGVGAVVGFAATGLGAIIDGATQTLSEKYVNASRELNEAQDAFTKANAKRMNLGTLIDNYTKLQATMYDSEQSLKDFNQASANLAEAFPSLISGYDSQGNAIINLAAAEQQLLNLRLQEATTARQLAKADYNKQKYKVKNLEAGLVGSDLTKVLGASLYTGDKSSEVTNDNSFFLYDKNASSFGKSIFALGGLTGARITAPIDEKGNPLETDIAFEPSLGSKEAMQYILYAAASEIGLGDKFKDISFDEGNSIDLSKFNLTNEQIQNLNDSLVSLITQALSGEIEIPSLSGEGQYRGIQLYLTGDDASMVANNTLYDLDNNKVTDVGKNYSKSGYGLNDWFAKTNSVFAGLIADGSLLSPESYFGISTDMSKSENKVEAYFKNKKMWDVMSEYYDYVWSEYRFANDQIKTYIKREMDSAAEEDITKKIDSFNKESGIQDVLYDNMETLKSLVGDVVYGNKVFKDLDSEGVQAWIEENHDEFENMTEEACEKIMSGLANLTKDSATLLFDTMENSGKYTFKKFSKILTDSIGLEPGSELYTQLMSSYKKDNESVYSRIRKRATIGYAWEDELPKYAKDNFDAFNNKILEETNTQDNNPYSTQTLLWYETQMSQINDLMDGELYTQANARITFLKDMMDFMSNNQDLQPKVMSIINTTDFTSLDSINTAIDEIKEINEDGSLDGVNAMLVSAAEHLSFNLNTLVNSAIENVTKASEEIDKIAQEASSGFDFKTAMEHFEHAKRTNPDLRFDEFAKYDEELGNWVYTQKGYETMLEEQRKKFDEDRDKAKAKLGELNAGSDWVNKNYWTFKGYEKYLTRQNNDSIDNALAQYKKQEANPTVEGFKKFYEKLVEDGKADVEEIDALMAEYDKSVKTAEFKSLDWQSLFNGTATDYTKERADAILKDILGDAYNEQAGYLANYKAAAGEQGLSAAETRKEISTYLSNTSSAAGTAISEILKGEGTVVSDTTAEILRRSDTAKNWLETESNKLTGNVGNVVNSAITLYKEIERNLSTVAEKNAAFIEILNKSFEQNNAVISTLSSGASLDFSAMGTLFDAFGKKIADYWDETTNTWKNLNGVTLDIFGKTQITNFDEFYTSVTGNEVTDTIRNTVEYMEAYSAWRDGIIARKNKKSELIKKQFDNLAKGKNGDKINASQLGLTPEVLQGLGTINDFGDVTITTSEEEWAKFIYAYANARKEDLKLTDEELMEYFKQWQAETTKKSEALKGLSSLEGISTDAIASLVESGIFADFDAVIKAGFRQIGDSWYISLAKYEELLKHNNITGEAYDSIIVEATDKIYSSLNGLDWTGLIDGTMQGFEHDSMRESIQGSLRLLGQNLSNEGVEAIMSIVANGGKEAVDTLAKIGVKLDYSKLKDMYSKKADNLSTALQDLVEISAGEVLDEATGKLLAAKGYAENINGVYVAKTAVDFTNAAKELYQDVENMFHAGAISLKKTNEAFVNAYNIENRGKTASFDMLNSADSVDLSTLSAAMEANGLLVSSLFNPDGTLSKAANWLDDNGNGTFRIKDFDAYASAVGLDKTTKAYKEAYTQFISGLIDDNSKAKTAEETFINAFTSAKVGDYINVTELDTNVIKALEAAGYTTTDGYIQILNRGVKLYKELLDSTDGSLSAESKKALSDAINEAETSLFGTDFTSLITGTINGKDLYELQSKLKTFLTNNSFVDDDATVNAILNGIKQGGEGALKYIYANDLQNYLTEDDIVKIYKAKSEQVATSIETALTASVGSVVDGTAKGILEASDYSLKQIGTTDNYIVEAVGNLSQAMFNYYETLANDVNATTDKVNAAVYQYLESRNANSANALSGVGGNSFESFLEPLAKLGYRLSVTEDGAISATKGAETITGIETLFKTLSDGSEALTSLSKYLELFGIDENTIKKDAIWQEAIANFQESAKNRKESLKNLQKQQLSNLMSAAEGETVVLSALESAGFTHTPGQGLKTEALNFARSNELINDDEYAEYLNQLEKVNYEYSDALAAVSDHWNRVTADELLALQKANSIFLYSNTYTDNHDGTYSMADSWKAALKYSGNGDALLKEFIKNTQSTLDGIDWADFSKKNASDQQEVIDTIDGILASAGVTIKGGTRAFIESVGKGNITALKSLYDKLGIDLTAEQQKQFVQAAFDTANEAKNQLMTIIDSKNGDYVDVSKLKAYAKRYVSAGGKIDEYGMMFISDITAVRDSILEHIDYFTRYYDLTTADIASLWSSKNSNDQKVFNAYSDIVSDITNVSADSVSSLIELFGYGVTKYFEDNGRGGFKTSESNFKSMIDASRNGELISEENKQELLKALADYYSSLISNVSWGSLSDVKAGSSEYQSAIRSIEELLTYKGLDLGAEQVLKAVANGGARALEQLAELGIINEMSSADLQAIYGQNLQRLNDAASNLTSYTIGTLVEDNLVGTLKKIGYEIETINGVNIITKAASSLKVATYKLFDEIRRAFNAGEASLQDYNDAYAQFRNTLINPAYDILSNAASYSIDSFAQLMTENGLKFNEVYSKGIRGGWLKDLGNGNLRILDPKNFIKALYPNIKETSEEYIKLFSSYNDAIIEAEKETINSTASQIDELGSMKSGDKLNVTFIEADDKLREGFEEAVKKYGFILDNGILEMNSNSNLVGLLNSLSGIGYDGSQEIKNALIRLSDEVRNVIKSYTDMISNAFSGSASNEEVNTIKEKFGLTDDDFVRTAEGWRMIESGAAKVYAQMKNIDALQGNKLLEEYVDSLDASNSAYGSIAATLKTIQSLQKSINESAGEQNETYRQQLALAEQILAVRSATDSSSYNFMEDGFSDAVESPWTLRKSANTAMSTISKAKVDKYFDREGWMEILDWIDKSNPTAELAKVDGVVMTAHDLLMKTAELATDYDDGSIRINFDTLKEAGIDFEENSANFENGVIEGVHKLAESNVQILDAQIAMLEASEAMNGVKIGEAFSVSDGTVTINDNVKQQIDNLGETAQNSEELKEILTFMGAEFDAEGKIAFSTAEKAETFFTALKKIQESGVEFDPDNYHKIWDILKDTIGFEDIEVNGEVKVGGMTVDLGSKASIELTNKDGITGYEISYDGETGSGSTTGKAINDLFSKLAENNPDWNGLMTADIKINDKNTPVIIKAVAQGVQMYVDFEGNVVGYNIDGVESTPEEYYQKLLKEKGWYTNSNSEIKIGDTVTHDGRNKRVIIEGVQTFEYHGITYYVYEGKLYKTYGDAYRDYISGLEKDLEEQTNSSSTPLFNKTGSDWLEEAKTRRLSINSTLELEGGMKVTYVGDKGFELTDENGNSLGAFSSYESLYSLITKHLLGGKELKVNGTTFSGKVDIDGAVEAVEGLLNVSGEWKLNTPETIEDGISDISSYLSSIETLLKTIAGTDSPDGQPGGNGDQGGTSENEIQEQTLNTLNDIKAADLLNGKLNGTLSTSTLAQLSAMLNNTGFHVEIIGLVSGEKNKDGYYTHDYELDLTKLAFTLLTGNMITGSNTGIDTPKSIDIYEEWRKSLESGEGEAVEIPIGANTTPAQNAVNTLISDIRSKTATIKVTAEIDDGTKNLEPINGGGGGSKPSYIAFGDSNAKGTLMGELGPELWVSNGHYYVAGRNGAEFVDLPEDAIVFNHRQTANLLNGKRGGHGNPIGGENKALAFAKGTPEGPAQASASDTIKKLQELRSYWSTIAELTASDLATKAGGGGGGGGADRGLHDIERWYNLLREISKLEQQITLEQKKRANMASGYDTAKSLRVELALLEKEKADYQELATLQRQYYDYRRKELEDSWLGQYIFRYDSDGLMQYISGEGRGLNILETLNATDEKGVAKLSYKQQLAYLQSLGFDTSELTYKSDGTKAKTEEEKMQVFWDNIDNQMKELDDLYDSYNDAISSVEDNVKKQTEILKQFTDNQLKVENNLLKAIEDREKAEIDALKDQADTLKNATDEYVNGLKDTLDKERQLYDKQKSDSELIKLQRRLGILQRSGGSASEIASLQQQIDSKLQSSYFEDRSSEIDLIKSASDAQIEKLEKQIDIMNDILTYQKDNGLLWNEVYNMMESSSPQEMQQFISDYIEDYRSKSATDRTEESKETLKEFEMWYENLHYGKSYEDTYNDNPIQSLISGSGIQSFLGSLENGQEHLRNFNDQVYAVGDVAYQKALAEGLGYSEAGDAALKAIEEYLKQVELELGMIKPEGIDGTYKAGSSDTNPNLPPSGQKVYWWTDAAGNQHWTTNLDYIKQNAGVDGKHLENGVIITTNGSDVVGVVKKDGETGSLTDKKDLEEAIQKEAEEQLKKHGLVAFSSGGVDDFTGLAMLHGTKSKPEAVLNADDYALLKSSLFSGSTKSTVRAYEQFVDFANELPMKYSKDTTNNESVVIDKLELNLQAEIGSDYDAQRAAQQVMSEIEKIARQSGNSMITRR